MPNKNPQVKDVVDRYFILVRELSSTGHSMIFEARHVYTERLCIVKILRPAARSMATAPERLLREGKLLTIAREASVPEVLNAGVCTQFGPYIALELLKGRSLDGILVARQRLSVQDTVHLGYALCTVFGDIHAAGVIHRDVKPGNIFLAPGVRGDRVVIIDFDIAIHQEDDVRPQRITSHGDVLGTPEYMSPEQFAGNLEEVDERADIYGLAATLYECLTGGPPFPGGVSAALRAFSTHASAPPAHERLEGVPRALSAVLATALSRVRGERPANMREFAALITSATGLRPDPVRLLSTPDRSGAPQRRRHVRAPYVTPVRLLHGADTIDGHSEDISEGGLFFVGRRPIPTAPEFTARFALPSSGKIVEVPTTVRWNREHKGNFAVGLEFLEMPSQHLSEVALYTLLLVPKELEPA